MVHLHPTTVITRQGILGWALRVPQDRQDLLVQVVPISTIIIGAPASRTAPNTSTEQPGYERAPSSLADFTAHQPQAFAAEDYKPTTRR